VRRSVTSAVGGREAMECRFARRDKSVSQNNVEFTDWAEIQRAMQTAWR